MESFNMNLLQNPEVKVPVESIDISFTATSLGLGYGKIAAPEVVTEEAKLRSENMKEHFVRVEINSPSDCIDGRKALRLLSGTVLEAPRPGVAGGAAVTGFAAAELTSYFGDSNKDVKEKFETIVERLEDNSGGVVKIVVGGHVDEDAVNNHFEDEKTGCGAADKLIGNISLLSTHNIDFIDSEGNSRTETDDEVLQRLETVKLLTKAVIMNSGYYSIEDVDVVMDEVIYNASEITSKAKLDSWSGSIMRETISTKGEDRLVVLDTSTGGVHGHTERKVLFNYVDNATFDQDSYYAKTETDEGEGREVFDVDVWHIRDISNKLANSPDESQAGKLFVAGVAFQIATYLGLCDGSHRAFFAKEV